MHKSVAGPGKTFHAAVSSYFTKLWQCKRWFSTKMIRRKMETTHYFDINVPCTLHSNLVCTGHSEL